MEKIKDKDRVTGAATFNRMVRKDSFRRRDLSRDLNEVRAGSI